MSADLYHIEFEHSENISNLPQGKYIEPSNARHIDKIKIASYALIKDYKTSDKSNAKALMASDFHKCFLLPSEKCSSPRVILSGGRRIRRPQSNP